MHHETRDPPGEPGGKVSDDRRAALVEHVDAAVEVNHRQLRLRGREGEDPVELVRSAGIDLGCKASLREPQLREAQQRVIAADPLLEQSAEGWNRGRCRGPRLIDWHRMWARARGHL